MSTKRSRTILRGKSNAALRKSDRLAKEVVVAVYHPVYLPDGRFHYAVERRGGTQPLVGIS